MAKKETKVKSGKGDSKNVLERVYIIPLRRETLKVPFYKKSKKAIRAIREFVKKHMKTETVLIGKYLNLEVWKHGIKNPPHKVKVDVTKDDKGTVRVELFGAPKEEKKDKKKEAKKTEEQKKETEDPKAEKISEAVEEKKEEKLEKAKEQEKESIKELKKEHPTQHIKQQQIPKNVEMHQTAPKSV